jgi:hypothetical protein
MHGEKLDYMRKSTNESLYSVTKQPRIKIDDKSGSFVSDAQIREQLGLKNGVESLHALDLNDHSILYEQIQVIFANLFSFIEDRVLEVALKGESGAFQLDGQRRFVCAFEKPRSQFPVYFDRAADNLLGQLIGLVHLILGKTITRPVARLERIGFQVHIFS